MYLTPSLRLGDSPVEHRPGNRQVVMYSVIYRSTVKSCSSAEMPILRTSIRFRTVLMVNAVVAGMIVLFAYITGIVAGRILEEQLVRRTAVDTCRFLSSQNLAINDTMLRYLDQLFMVHFVRRRSRSGGGRRVEPAGGDGGGIPDALGGIGGFNDGLAGGLAIRPGVGRAEATGRGGRSSAFCRLGRVATGCGPNAGDAPDHAGDASGHLACHAFFSASGTGVDATDCASGHRNGPNRHGDGALRSGAGCPLAGGRPPGRLSIWPIRSIG